MLEVCFSSSHTILSHDVVVDGRLSSFVVRIFFRVVGFICDIDAYTRWCSQCCYACF